MGDAGEEICVFIRDEQTGRFLFNPMAIEAMGFDPVQIQARGYLLKEPPEAREALMVNKGDRTRD